MLTRLRSRRGQPRYHFLAFVLVLAVAGTLAAAGSGLEDEGRPGEAEAVPGTRAPGRAGDILTVAWATPPESLDPALADDHTALNLVAALGDPLVRLRPSLEPAPELAERWEVSPDGLTFTFHLREEGRWSNGTPLTAFDFEYAWRRVLDPELRSPHAPLLSGIRGAKAYNRCAAAGAVCRRLARQVGIEAPDAETLVVSLAAPRPWFPSEVAHPAFLPVHRPTVERYGKRWTSPRRIVTSGPFSLGALGRESFTLVRRTDWRAAGRVALERVEGRVIPNGSTRVLAFDAGEVQALDGSGLPGTELPALRERREYEVYPALASYLLAFNLASVTDVHQRRAMALAIDRVAFAERVVGRDVAPATGFIPAAAPRLVGEPAESPWLPAGGDLKRARVELELARRVKRELTLLHLDEPREREIASAVAAAWRELGIQTELRSRAADDFLKFKGPLSRDSVDLYRVEQRPRFADPYAFVSPWGCRATPNKTNFCLSAYDRLLERARAEPGAAERDTLYAEAETLLAGDAGAMPGIPLFWDVYPNLEALAVRDSFRIDPLGRIDFTAIDRR